VVSLFFLVVLIILLNSRNLVLILLLLEILGFFLVYFISIEFASRILRDYFSLVIFSLLVIEGVIALSGLISLVSFAGGDYLASSSLLKF
jgi:hypothetical protein